MTHCKHSCPDVVALLAEFKRKLVEVRAKRGGKLFRASKNFLRAGPNRRLRVLVALRHTNIIPVYEAGWLRARRYSNLRRGSHQAIAYSTSCSHGRRWPVHPQVSPVTKSRSNHHRCETPAAFVVKQSQPLFRQHQQTTEF